jgi:UDP-N-acetylglucosamine--N-acetylmuramyl-(pentapeptide) pyrophosphoryl-undecaprenol N-acetylglucosamine transferase
VPFAAISSGKLRRYADVRNLIDPFKVLLGLAQSLRLVRTFKPHAAFAAGGFAAVPPIVAARVNGVRTLIHQQDVEPGLANRLLAPFAQRITVSLPSSMHHFRNAVVTGNPVRREILDAEPQSADTPLLLVTGGGTGALGLNRLVAAAAPRLVERVRVLHLTGRGRGVPSPTDSPRYAAKEFLVDEMPQVLASATIVLSRAGMGTLSELAALRKPALIVPLPGSHQWANARAFARLGAIEVADQDALTPETLSKRILSLLDDQPRRERLSQAIGDSMPRDAAQRIAHELLALTRWR